jgi:hypothetical protein
MPCTAHRLVPVLLLVAPVGCREDDDHGDDDTTQVGSLEGLYDDVAIGFNFPFDIAIAPDDPETHEIEGGDVFAASYGTSEVRRVVDPSDESSGREAEPFFDGTSAGLRGATAVSVPHHGHVWAAFEQGGTSDHGGIAVLASTGDLATVLDAEVAPDTFHNPGGLCYGGVSSDGELVHFFVVNLGDGSVWRVDASSADGSDPTFAKVGAGLATGTPGKPQGPGGGLTSSKELPQGGARGCAYADGSLYVADAQNARIVRFDDADVGEDVQAVALEDTPSELVTYPTGVTINAEGHLIVISYDNAHAFVTLELPGGGFLDNGLHDLNVNAGNYGVAVAEYTIWFSRANNSNGALRAITPDDDTPPSTAGPFPPQ